jgi:hypothetical protein
MVSIQPIAILHAGKLVFILMQFEVVPILWKQDDYIAQGEFP